MGDWVSVCGALAASQGRLVETLDGLDDAALRADSALPGWSRGHVAAHLARNAESYGRLLDWARTGVRTPQYPSREVRSAGIEAGAGRSAAQLGEEVRETGESFLRQASELPEAAWHATVAATAGWLHPAWYTLYRRWREVEIHHVDLDAGYGPRDWPEAYVRWELTDSPAALRGVLPVRRVVADDLGLIVEVSDDGEIVADEGRHVLAWLSGRARSPRIELPAPVWPGRYPAAV